MAEHKGKLAMGIGKFRRFVNEKLWQRGFTIDQQIEIISDVLNFLSGSKNTIFELSDSSKRIALRK